MNEDRLFEADGELWEWDEEDAAYGGQAETTCFGPCCRCEQSGPTVRNILMLPRLAPVAGTGWGCVVCDLPADGAIAVVCDGCLGQEPRLAVSGCLGQEPRLAVSGYASEGGRIPVSELRGAFEHRHEAHPEFQFVKVTVG